MGAVGMYTEDPKKYDQTFVANYAQINIIPELKRIPGVGSAGNGSCRRGGIRGM